MEIKCVHELEGYFIKVWIVLELTYKLEAMPIKTQETNWKQVTNLEMTKIVL